MQNTAVFVLYCQELKERVSPMMAELSRLNLDAIPIWDFPTPIHDVMERVTSRDIYTERESGWRITLSHYRAMKTALAMGAEQAFIMEDDVRFLRDTKAVWKALDEAPKDWQELRLTWGIDRFNFKLIGEERKENIGWSNLSGLPIVDFGAYMMKADIMRMYVDKVEQCLGGHGTLTISDRVLFGSNHKLYGAVPLLCVQKQFENANTAHWDLKEKAEAFGLDLERDYAV